MCGQYIRAFHKHDDKGMLHYLDYDPYLETKSGFFQRDLLLFHLEFWVTLLKMALLKCTLLHFSPQWLCPCCCWPAFDNMSYSLFFDVIHFVVDLCSNGIFQHMPTLFVFSQIFCRLSWVGDAVCDAQYISTHICKIKSSKYQWSKVLQPSQLITVAVSSGIPVQCHNQS